MDGMQNGEVFTDVDEHTGNIVYLVFYLICEMVFWGRTEMDRIRFKIWLGLM